MSQELNPNLDTSAAQPRLRFTVVIAGPVHPAPYLADGVPGLVEFRRRQLPGIEVRAGDRTPYIRSSGLKRYLPPSDSIDANAPIAPLAITNLRARVGWIIAHTGIRCPQQRI